MNKKSQQDNPIAIAGGIFIVIILFGFLGTYLHLLSCSDEIAQRDACYIDLSYWKNQYTTMNETITNCSNLIQEQKDICDNRINESVYNYTISLKNHKDYVTINKVFFAVYHILVIFLYIPLTINLFKITFEVGLSEKWKKTIGFLKTFWLILRIIIWIVLTLVFIIYIYSLLTITPL